MSKHGSLLPVVQSFQGALTRGLNTKKWGGGAGPAVIGWPLTHGPARKALGLFLAAAVILLFLLNLRRAGERAGRVAQRLDAAERNDAVHREMLNAAARRPHDRDALVDRLRNGRF